MRREWEMIYSTLLTIINFFRSWEPSQVYDPLAPSAHEMEIQQSESSSDDESDGNNSSEDSDNSERREMSNSEANKKKEVTG